MLLGVLLVLIATPAYQCKSDNAMENVVENQQDETIQILHIALQDGFENETVIVLIDDEEVYQGEDVKTDFRIGLAESFEVPLPEEPATIEVRLPNRQVSGSIELDTLSTPNVGVSYLDGELRFRLSEGPFGYM